jgi:GxxExxY protein
MNANDTNKILHKELSYAITGLLFQTHNDLGRYSREKQYADYLEKLLQQQNVKYVRERKSSGDLSSGNRPDFVIEDKIVIELKAKRLITREDYRQLQRYLQTTGFRLGLLVNFHNHYLKPVRVVRIENKHSFV